MLKYIACTRWIGNGGDFDCEMHTMNQFLAAETEKKASLILGEREMSPPGQFKCAPFWQPVRQEPHMRGQGHDTDLPG